MKKIVFSLLVVFGLAAGVVGVIAQTAEYRSGSGAIGSTTNGRTIVNTCYAVCTSKTVNCVFAIQQYASVSTGPIIDNRIYPLANTAGATPFAINVVGGNGAYWKDLTGATVHNCSIVK